MLVNRINGPLKNNYINSRYFADNDGKAIFLTGSHTWAVMNDMWLENSDRRPMDYPAFLQMMQNNHHNFLRLWQFNMQTQCAPWNRINTCFAPQPYMRTGPGMAVDGKLKFDLTKFDPAYFDRLRERIIMAGRLGIYVSIMFFEAWAIKRATPEQNPWNYYPFNENNNINGVDDNPLMPDGRAWKLFSLDCPKILAAQKRYVREVVDCVNDLDNVLYEVCNEVPNTREALRWQDEICQYIRQYEKSLPRQHMIGITAEGGEQDNDLLYETSADWISPGYGKLYEYRYNPPFADGRKVVLSDTDHLWGHGCEIAWIWKSFTRGLNLLFMDPWEPIPGELNNWQDGKVTMNQRYYYLWDDCRRNLGYARNISIEFDLNFCIPSITLCTSTYCLAWENEQYICYFPSGGFEALDLRQTQGVFNVEWLDPASGLLHRVTQVNGGQAHVLTAPFSGPAVLCLYKQKKERNSEQEIFHSHQ